MTRRKVKDFSIQICGVVLIRGAAKNRIFSCSYIGLVGSGRGLVVRVLDSGPAL